jgi:hypothetical protein
MLQPLEQFICDRCAEVICSKREGWIEWLGTYEPHRASGFKIVHHKSSSPLKGKDGCYFYSDHRDRQDEHLDSFDGENLIYNLLYWIDVGPHISPDYTGPVASDLREWCELTKRLQLPYYEEARLYIDEAIADDLIDDPGNPHYLYSVSVLKKIAAKYSPYP